MLTSRFCDRVFVLRGLAALMLLAGLSLPAGFAQTTWYVDDDAPNDPGPGDPLISDPNEDGSAAHPFDAIQDAIDDAVNGDIVDVADGAYTGEGNRNLDPGGRTITIRGASGDPELCIIDCEDEGRGFYIHSAEGSSTVIEGFTITNGNGATGGGGMYNVSSSPTVVNCIFSNNVATSHGGGMYNLHGSPTVTDCVFIGNSSTSHGGGMSNTTVYGNHRYPTLTNCLFLDNFALNQGGGIFISDSMHSTLIGCRFNGNKANGGGGGIYASHYSTTALANCVFSGNTTPDRGGAIFNDGTSTVTAVNCTFSGNTADFGGGVRADTVSTTTLDNCILWGNTATTEGHQISEEADYEVTVSYSCIQGGWFGEGNIDLDPLFVDPDGLDGTVGTEDDDLHLQDGSPCIGAGDNSTVQIATDYDGEDRIQHCRVDMGADETPYAGPDCNTNGIPDVCDIFDGTSNDCNANGIPDECDIASGVSEDLDADGVPDECVVIHNLTQNRHYVRLRTAIDEAVSGDEIEVGPGTYLERIDLLGKAITLRSTDGPEMTTIDGAPSGVPGDEGGSVVTCVSGEGPSTVIDGFTITNGNGATGGGGMYNVSSSPTVVNCIFSNNSASSHGGGMYNLHGSPTVTDCVFIGNSSTSHGGGMSNTTVYGNHRYPTLTNCLFLDNFALNQGGGIFISDSMHSTLIGCRFNGNKANGGGGGIYASHYSTTALANCVFSGNTTPGRGGGLFNDGTSTVTAVNCTFSGNTADFGGGVRADTVSTTTLANCILWGNTATTEGHQISEEADYEVTVSYSCIQGGWFGEGNIDLDPLFVDPDGLDGTVGTEDDDLHLEDGSPCLHAGDNESIPADTLDLDDDGDVAEPVPFDIDGDDRIQHCVVDIGADEAPYAGPDCNTNGVPDVCDVFNGASNDCNANGIPDECDIASGASIDIDPANGVPDECEPIRNVTQGTYYIVIQTAIDEADPNDEIQVGPGTYMERINLLGKAITLRSTHGPEMTTIDGAPSGVPGDEGGSVVTCTSAEGSSTVIEGFTITNGNGAAGGGGMYNVSSSPTVVNCIFSNNVATSHGGGMYNLHGSPTVTDCVFIGNSSSGHGGGMSNNTVVGNDRYPTVTNCLFVDNSVPHQGGGIFISGSIHSTLTSCRFMGNTADGGGGGIYASHYSTTALANCVFSGNTTPGRGGGLFNDGTSTVTAVNCTFSGNTADFGGGVRADTVSTTTLANCILWGNTATTEGHQISEEADYEVTVSYSCIQGGWFGEGNIDLDPLFVDPDGLDGTVGTEDDDLHLQDGSPCIGAGDNSTVQVAADYDGDDRIQHCRVDMGADETPYAGPDCNTNGIPDVCDIFDGTSNDCNANGIPDECDIASGTSEDLDANGVPDECAVIHNLTQNRHYVRLRTAIDEAVSGDEIEVGPGTYLERIDLLGKAITLRSTDGPEMTTIDGAPSGVPGDEGGSVVTCVSGEGPSTVIDGFTITNGNAATGGGGMYNVSNSPTVVNCIFSNNSASSHGGGMYNSHASPTVTDCVFIGNSSTSHGGGMSNNTVVGNHRYPTVTNCLFIGNSASAQGGGMLIGGSMHPTLTGCRFIGNAATLGGGGLYADNYSTTALANCVFSGNTTPDRGGAVFNDGYSDVTATNCTFSGNSANSGGGMHNDGPNCSVTLANCILWANTATTQGPQIWNNPGTNSTISATYSCIQGDWYGEGNIDVDPLLTSSGCLRTGSPCIDAGNGSPPGVDIGSDEFVDSDGDGLPDWWESAYPPASDPNGDPDGDGLSNIAEYERCSSDPIAAPYFVDGAGGDDAWDGLSATHDPNDPNSLAGPKQTIQAALDAACDGDTVLVLAGTYSDDGDRELDYAGKWLIIRAVDGPTATTLDCQGLGRAVDDTTLGGFGVLEGFRIINGAGDVGGGVRLDKSRLMLVNCVLEDNSATTTGGAIHIDTAVATVDDLTLGDNDSPTGDAGVIADGSIQLVGPLAVTAGTLEVRSSRFYGPGSIVLDASTDPDVELHVTGDEPGDPPTVVRSNITGTGDIRIDAGQQLWLEHGAIIDLSGGDPGAGCADPEGSADWGRITIDGALLVRDARIQNTNFSVTLANFEGAADIYNNDIDLLEASAGWGGEFFVEGNSTIECNVIRSIGDRYLDLDPDPNANPRPFIGDNKIFVTIVQGGEGEKGTLLELRSPDCDCTNPAICLSGAYQLSSGDGYSDLWALEELQIGDPNHPNAKLNLTNRSGFDYRDPGEICDPNALFVAEALYVKTLKMYPGAVLNTGLQRLYYQELVGAAGEDIDYVDPNDPEGWLNNGARIIDVPLLGFSLVAINMEDQTEFDLRIRARLEDPNDPQPLDPDYPGDPNDPDAPRLRGSIERIEHTEQGGVMEMKTQAEGPYLSASSVAAKGAFARAGEDEITIAFDYLFLQDSSDSGQPTELVVYFSDSPEVSTNLEPVALVWPPASGPGSIGSGEFARFHGTFPRGGLNFTRGTYVELELRGTNAAVRIDNFDPTIGCTNACYDVAGGDENVNDDDQLVMHAFFGQALGDLAMSCLDFAVSGDRYVDLTDYLFQDALLTDFQAFAECGSGLRTRPADGQRSGTPVVLPAEAKLLLAGKPVEPTTIPEEYYFDDYLYAADWSGACIGAEPMRPASEPAYYGYHANGRLARDALGRVHQIHAVQGLVRLEDAQVVVDPDSQEYGGATVCVGPNQIDDDEFLGAPLLDVAFHATDPNVVYVVPVVVQPPGFDEDTHGRYRAAAKLRLQTGGNYTVEALYGVDPFFDDLDAYPPELATTKVQCLREIEVGTQGNVYVLSAHDIGNNDWVLIYEEADPANETRVNISDDLAAPTALLVSRAKPDTLYLASAVDDQPEAQTRVWQYTIERNGDLATGLAAPEIITIARPDDGSVSVDDIGKVNALGEKGDGTLYVLGFAMPRLCSFDNGNYSCSTEHYDSLFTVPTLTIIPPCSPGPHTATRLDCHGLGFPVSLCVLDAESPGCPEDINGDGSITLADLQLLLSAYGASSGDPRFNPAADIDNDCTVGLADLQLLLSRYGQACS